jgi:hypothetical protein
VSLSNPSGSANVSATDDDPVDVPDADGSPLSVTNAATTAAPRPSAMMPTNTAIHSVRLFIPVACRKDYCAGPR